MKPRCFIRGGIPPDLGGIFRKPWLADAVAGTVRGTVRRGNNIRKREKILGRTERRLCQLRVIASGNWPSRSASWAFVSVPKRASQSGVRVPDDHDGTGLELVGSDADDLLVAGFILPTRLRGA